MFNKTTCERAATTKYGSTESNWQSVFQYTFLAKDNFDVNEYFRDIVTPLIAQLMIRDYALPNQYNDELVLMHEFYM